MLNRTGATVSQASTTVTIPTTTVFQKGSMILKIDTSVSDLDPFHFGNPDPDPFYKTDPGSKKSAKIIKNFHKNQPKSQEYHIFFFAKILNLC